MNLLAIAFLKLLPFTYFGVTCAKPKFFFLPPWYEYLPLQSDNTTGTCLVKFKFPGDIWTVGLAILDMLLRLAGFVAVVSIIIAGVMYVTSVGNSDRAASARRRLYNSLIGLAIVLIATGFVQFIGNKLGG